MRPADANETALAWRVALEREDGPVAFALSRQNIETLDRDEVAPVEGVLRGGYVLWDAPGGDPELILLSTGAEVGETLKAAKTLAEEGRRARVVSMPCMELFEAQDEDYRQQVLPPTITARLAVEPGARMSWWRWVGDRGDVIGLERFGASAPGTTVLEKLGFTAEHIAERARSLI